MTAPVAPVARSEHDGAPSPEGGVVGGGSTAGGGGGGGWGRGGEGGGEGGSGATPRVLQPAAPRTAPSTGEAKPTTVAEGRGSRSSREVALEQQLRALTAFSATDSILAVQRAAPPPSKPAAAPAMAPAERTVSLGLSESPPAELRGAGRRTAADAPPAPSPRLNELLAGSGHG